MTQETWDQIEQLWKQALQLPAPQREDFVKKAVVADDCVRREVLAMLRQEAHSADFLETPAIEEEARQMAREKLNAPTLAMKGERFGAYEIISELGAGGMGTVFLARDLHLQRTVALKVLPEVPSGPYSSSSAELARRSSERGVCSSLNETCSSS